MHKRAALVIISIASLLPFTLSGQKQVNSPFARYNLGILEPAGSFRSLGMGGTTTAMRDNNTIYFTNPASYTAIDTNSFLFDFGLDYGLNRISDGTSKHTSGDLNFDHIMMGFPIKKGFGFTTGLYNISNGYYKISETVAKGDAGYDSVAGGYASYHAGSGGLTAFYMGTGLRLTKFLSAGVNMSLLFGTIRRTNEMDFTDYNMYQDNVTEKLQLSGINFDYGLQLNMPVKKDYFLNAGISLSNGNHYKSTFENLTYRFSAFSNADTLSYVADDSTKAFLPGTLRMGISFGKKDKLIVGVDYTMTRWSKASFHGSATSAADTKALLFGVEFTPDKYSNYSYLKRIQYRIGGHVEDNYLIYNGVQVKQFGLSCGVGIPMRFLSRTNVFLDFTRKSYSGTTFSHYENYITMGVSLNLYDWWFVKRKYD